MKIVVTCGPSYEPIDQARRITNFSTGRLGIALANAMAARGWTVICLKGEMASCPDPLAGPQAKPFTTNDDLARRLEELSRSEKIDAVLHAAALADFRVDQVSNEAGAVISSSKFSTREGRLHLTLAPALKVLPLLRGWFPSAYVAGWKYELEGARSEAFTKAWKQVKECRTNACVLNGSAYGSGFAVCRADGRVEECADTPALARQLIQAIEARG